MGINERHTVKKLNKETLEKIDLDYFNVVFELGASSIKEVPSTYIQFHSYINRSSRLLFLCSHYHIHKKLSLQQIANKYGLSRGNIQRIIESYRVMKNIGICD